MVAGYPVSPARCDSDAAEDIATTYHDADFDAHLAYAGDIPGNLVDDIDVDSKTLFSHQCLAGGLEYDATISGCLIHAHLSRHSSRRAKFVGGRKCGCNEA